MRNEVFVYLEIYSVYLEIYDYGVLVQGVRFPDARRYLQAVFKEITWERTSQILNRTTRKEGDNFFEMYRACVLTLRNAPEWTLLKARLA
jgi:hypothetical protein